MDNRTRELVFQLSNGFCTCSDGCRKEPTDVHHKLANTKVNRRRFPLFIDSIFNLVPINNGCHLTKPVPRIKEHEAMVYEKWLEINLAAQAKGKSSNGG